MPIWDMLDDEEKEEVKDTPKCSGRAKRNQIEVVPPIYTASELINLFEDFDGCWFEKYDSITRTIWKRYSKKDREDLTSFFTKHPDIELRSAFCNALGEWGNSEELVTLLDDPCFGVRKSAAYNLKKVPKDESLAKHLWKVFDSNHSGSTFAREALDSYIVHAPESGLNETFLEIAREDERESAKSSSIWELDKRDAIAEIESLVPLLQTEPLVTWSVHCALIEAAPIESIRPYVKRLSAIDDIYIQDALARKLS